MYIKSIESVTGGNEFKSRSHVLQGRKQHTGTSLQVSGGHCGRGFNGLEESQTAGIQLRFFCRAPTSSCDSGKHWYPISIPMIEKP